MSEWVKCVRLSCHIIIKTSLKHWSRVLTEVNRRSHPCVRVRERGSVYVICSWYGVRTLSRRGSDPLLHFWMLTRGWLTTWFWLSSISRQPCLKGPLWHFHSDMIYSQHLPTAGGSHIQSQWKNKRMFMIIDQSTFRTALDGVWPCGALFLKTWQRLMTVLRTKTFWSVGRLSENLHMAFSEK